MTFSVVLTSCSVVISTLSLIPFFLQAEKCEMAYWCLLRVSLQLAIVALQKFTVTLHYNGTVS